MSEGTLDLAIGHFTRIDGAGYFEQTLFEQGFVCLARAGHPFIDKTLTLEHYLEAQHIVVSQEGRSQERYEDQVRHLGLARRVALQSPHFMSVPLLVSQSDMITVVPLAVGQIYAHLLDLSMLPLPFDVKPVELRQFWHRRSHTDPAIVWLRKLVAELFLGRDPTQSGDSPFWSSFIQA